jgi:DNA-binding LacI/PurR family transcriptional regulator
MIIFDRVSQHLSAPSVRIDNKEGGMQATEHLIEQGYKRIAILAGPKNLSISNDRMDGYLAALKKHRIKADPELIVHCDFNQQYAYNATLDLLHLKQRPDAIFTISATGWRSAPAGHKRNRPADAGRYRTGGLQQ